MLSAPRLAGAQAHMAWVCEVLSTGSVCAQHLPKTSRRRALIPRQSSELRV